MDGRDRMKKIIIAAMDEEKGIGRNGELPWHYTEDMEHFKQKTMGHPVVMGKNTYLSLPESVRPLPGRTNIVLTRSSLEIDDIVEIANSLEEAWNKAENHDDEKVFIAGGESVYSQTLDTADKMIITRVPGTHDADTYFPDWDRENWILESKEEKGKLRFEEYRSPT